LQVTVILCTYNRCGSLIEALESVAASSMPESVEWDVLVVDNNSRDKTRQVVEEFRSRHPRRFRYIFEPCQGKSNALNLGIREAEGDVLAFMDDDVKVEPMWLRNLTAPLCDSLYGGVAGRVLLDPDFSPPTWLGLKEPYNVGGVLAQFDRGDLQGQLVGPPCGASMAFRKHVLQKYGGFRVDLGPCPGSEIRGEDTELGHRLTAAGERILYEPSAIVYHPVPDSRVKKSYFLVWYLDHGRGLVRGWERGTDIAGIPRRFFTLLNLMFGRLPASAVIWLLSVEPQRRFFHKCWVWAIAGQIFEIYRQRNNGRARAVQREEERA
jgi:glucosyl-dolichyl phosphate glucuronosyltransferase